MKVYGKCKNCQSEIEYSTSENTRVEFAMRVGENKTLNCKSCNTTSDFHVDELYAKESKIAQIGAGIVSLIGIPLVFFVVNPVFTSSENNNSFYVVGGFLLTPIVIYGIFKNQDQNRVNSFNRHKLKGRIHNL